VDLRLPVSQAIEQVSPAPAALEVDMASNALIVEADELHLQRVVVNLLENAIRYTPPNGTIRVRVARVSEEAVVEVSDTGEGIAPEHLEEIFERFFRVDSARNSEEGGTGLGLSICKSIVEAHGGRILAESEIGRGTTFRVLLPISKFK
jgi:signal transduction histidine kinase